MFWMMWSFDLWYNFRRLCRIQSSYVSVHTDPFRIGRSANGCCPHAFDITDLSLLRHPTARTNHQLCNKRRYFIYRVWYQVEYQVWCPYIISGRRSGRIYGIMSLYYIRYNIRPDIWYVVRILYQIWYQVGYLVRYTYDKLIELGPFLEISSVNVQHNWHWNFALTNLELSLLKINRAVEVPYK